MCLPRSLPATEVIVVLGLDVSADGTVEKVEILRGAGEPFDRAALDAGRRFRFEPARLSTGEAVPVSIEFKLTLSPPPEPPPPPVRLNGILLQRGRRLPLRGVEILIRVQDRTVTSTRSDEQGRFSVEVQSPEFTVLAAPEGHDRLEASIQAVPGEEREEVYYLEAVSADNETVITAERLRREVVRQTIPKEVVRTAAGTQGDVLKVVQNLPGAARGSFGAGAVILRGTSSEDSRVYLHGHELPILYHFGGLRSTVNSAFLEAVDYVPGNFAPEYGRAIGGVVDVRLRDPAIDDFHGEADLNLYDAGFMVEGPLSDQVAVGAAFHRSYVDTFLNAVLPEDAPISFDTAPRYYDYQFLATWRPRPNHTLRLIWLGSLDQTRLILSRPSDDPVLRGAIDARIMFHDLQLRQEWNVRPGVREEFSLMVGLQQFKTRIGPDLYFNLDDLPVSGRFALEFEPTDRLALRWGLDVLYDQVSIDLLSPLRPLEGEQSAPISAGKLYGFSNETELFQPATFLELRWSPTERLMLLPSLRLDHYSQLDRTTLDPRVTARYRLFPATTLVAGLGMYQQPPTPDQSAERLGNPALLAPRSLQTSLGAEQDFAKGLSLAVTGFHKRLDNLVSRNQAFFSDPDAVPYLSEGTGRIYGLELLFKVLYGKRLSGWLAYSYQRSFRTDQPGEIERRFEYDQPHNLTLLGSTEFARVWSASARFRLVSGNPTTPVVGSLYDAESDTYLPVFGETFSDRLAPFHQLDLRLDRRFTFDTFLLAAFLDVQNVYNRGNEEGTQYNYDYSRRKGLTGLPILPILGLRGEW